MTNIDRTKILVLAAAAFGVGVAACNREGNTATVSATPNTSAGGAHQGSCGSCGAHGDGGTRAAPTSATSGAHQGSCGSCGSSGGRDGGTGH